MVMDLRGLQCLLAASGAGSFARTAQSLGLSTPTVSRRIARLEDELGVTLFERGQFGIRLTTTGKAVMVHVRRALDDIDALEKAGHTNGTGMIGSIRLGVRMPPIGEPLRSLLTKWRREHSGVMVTLLEMPDQDLYSAVERRDLDVAFLAGYGLWPSVATEPLYKERLFAALPQDHPLSDRGSIDWALLRGEVVLVQDWESSHATREFYASLVGAGSPFRSHPAGKQSVFALVGAGFGVTLATESQTQVKFPGVAFKPIAEENAWVQIKLAWAPECEDAVVGRFIRFIRDHARTSMASVEHDGSQSTRS